jgi:hypothetical protein
MNNLSGPAVNRRLKCMEEIDNNLAEMEDFSGKDIYLKTFFLYTKALYTVNQCCGSGIRCLFDPWIRDPE